MRDTAQTKDWIEEAAKLRTEDGRWKPDAAYAEIQRLERLHANESNPERKIGLFKALEAMRIQLKSTAN